LFFKRPGDGGASAGAVSYIGYPALCVRVIIPSRNTLIRAGNFAGPFLSAMRLDRAKEELDRVADVIFSYDLVHKGKKIVGWDFVQVSNKQKRKGVAREETCEKKGRKRDRRKWVGVS
jgi:hypothetical protein